MENEAVQQVSRSTLAVTLPGPSCSALSLYCDVSQVVSVGLSDRQIFKKNSTSCSNK